jgi:hypothetical protein
MNARQIVKRGVKVLDQAMPGWWRPGKIDLKSLDLANCDLCVLGQLYANGEVGYYRGQEILKELHAEGKLRLPARVPEVNPEELGFAGFRGLDYDALTDVWDAEIRVRRRKAKVRVN